MIRIAAYDHVGIRVTDRDRALAFYQKLGFSPDRAWCSEGVAEIVCGTVRINLILNGEPVAAGHNIMIDDPVKWPGVTHPAFIVDRLGEVVDWAAAEGVAITEGPVDWGRRTTCFLRDPDGTVLEFNELKR